MRLVTGSPSPLIVIITIIIITITAMVETTAHPPIRSSLMCGACTSQASSVSDFWAYAWTAGLATQRNFVFTWFVNCYSHVNFEGCRFNKQRSEFYMCLITPDTLQPRVYRSACCGEASPQDISV